MTNLSSLGAIYTSILLVPSANIVVFPQSQVSTQLDGKSDP